MKRLSKLFLLVCISILVMSVNAFAAVSAEEKSIYIDQRRSAGTANAPTKIQANAAGLKTGPTTTSYTKTDTADYAASFAETTVDSAGELPGSVSLIDTINLTLINNPNLKALQEYRQAAEFDRKKSRSGFFPTVDASGGVGFGQWNYDGNRHNQPGTKNKDNYYSRADANITVQQTIWDGFAAWSRYRMADATLTSAEHRLFDNAEAYSLDAILAHIELCRQKKMIALSELNVLNHRRILSSQMDREKAGASTKADVTQTQARLSRAETSLVEARLAYEAAIYNYRNLTGHTPGQLMVPKAPGTAFPSLENVLSSSMTNNSKVLSKQADIEAIFAQKEMDKAAFQPRIYLAANYSYSDSVETSNTYSWGTSFMLRTEWNLYNGHYDWYNLKGNKARIRQANMELQALRENLAEETSNTWSTWLANQEQVRFFSNGVLYNTQTRDMYLQQFNVGSRSLLDVLDSENELYSTSMQLVTAQLNYIAGQYRLLTLSGKLLETLGIDRNNLVVETDGNDFDLQRDLAGWQVNNEVRSPQ